MKNLLMKYGVVVGGMLVALLLTTYGQNTSQVAPQQQKKARAAAALRIINTAEMDFKRSNGRFASFAELVSSGRLSKLNADPGHEEDLVAGYKMHLVVAGSGASYAIDLRDTEPCETAFFTNDSGVIFHGQAFGCPSTSPERAASLNK